MKTQAAAAILVLTIAICAGTNAAAQTGATPSGTSAPKAGQFSIVGTLVGALDSKKKKPGEEVVMKTTAVDVHLSDGTVIARGSKIVGHITEAKARAGGDAESSLGIVFDKITLKDGKTLAIAGLLRAVAPSNEGNGGGVDYGDLKQTVSHTMAGTDWGAAPTLNEHSEGAQGIKGLQLLSDGMLKSGEKTIKLDYGAQIVLNVQLASGK
ncbi:MAG: hypothetical protein ABSB87_17035 [Terriglobales bacterium]